MGVLDGRTDFRAGYVRRVVDGELDALLPSLPAILLDGPKAVGKTATALQRAGTVRRLDRPQMRAIAEADTDVALAGETPVLLDEWQRVPPLWDAVKIAVDTNPVGGRFLLTGSTPAGGTHSGAGRITGVRMRPLTLPERGVSAPTVSLARLLSGGRPVVAGECPLGLADYTDLILASGFPGMQHLSGRALDAQLDGYLDRIVDADMEEAGLRVRRPATLRAWLRAYAAATATTTAWDTIRDAASAGTQSKPARGTTTPYIDVLTRLRVLDDLPAWIPGRNRLTRLTLSPKHHLADPALAARLVGVNQADLLEGREPGLIGRDGPFLGALFESLAVLSVRVFAAAAMASVSHLRLHDGRHEIDMIVGRSDQRVVAVEVKLADTVTTDDVRHLKWLANAIGENLLDSVVLTTGPIAYRRPDGIAVIPLGLLGP